MSTTRHFGVIAHSCEGAALCFKSFCQNGFAEFGPHQHPDVTLDCIAMGQSMHAWDQGDYASIRAILARSVDRLARAGADFAACPDNTAHLALEFGGPRLALPLLHIADVVAEAASRDGRKCVGILGTRYTMDGSLYPRVLASHALGYRVPEAGTRADINRIIFDELVEGRFTDVSRARFVRAIEALAADGCDSVALVCTEIPLLISPEVSPLPTLDSTRLLAKAAFEVSVGRRALPVWRGGPFGADPPASLSLEN